MSAFVDFVRKSVTAQVPPVEPVIHVLMTEKPLLDKVAALTLWLRDMGVNFDQVQFHFDPSMAPQDAIDIDVRTPYRERKPRVSSATEAVVNGLELWDRPGVRLMTEELGRNNQNGMIRDLPRSVAKLARFVDLQRPDDVDLDAYRHCAIRLISAVVSVHLDVQEQALDLDGQVERFCREVPELAHLMNERLYWATVQGYVLNLFRLGRPNDEIVATATVWQDLLALTQSGQEAAVRIKKEAAGNR